MIHSPLRLTIVDAFTRHPGQGNRAGVVLDAAGLDDATMLAAARAVAASETAFLYPGDNGADLRLRWFTPGEEVEFCGHATVATFHVLAEIGRLAVPGRYTLDCLAGRLEVELEPAGDHSRVWIATPRRPWDESPIPAESLMPLLGGTAAMLDRALPVMRSGSKIFLPLVRREDLWSLAPRWDELAAAGLAHDVWGFYAFTRETFEKDHVTHGRLFAPAVGVREDPATGAANGPLGEYLAMHGVLRLPPQGGVVRARSEQGDAMGRPGRLDLEVTGSPGRIERARVGGEAVTVMEGTLWPGVGRGR